MRVLGFDPGSAVTGFGVVEKRGNRLCHVRHGVLRTPAQQPVEVRLKSLFEQAQLLIADCRPDAVAVEKLYFKQNVSTGIGVAQARGVLLLAVALMHMPVSEFSPTEMKTAVTGYGRADKKQLQEMVKRLLNLEAIPRPDDAADALALAICQAYSGSVHRPMDGPA